MKLKGKLIKLLSKIKREFSYYNIIRKSKNPKYTHIYYGSPSHGNLGDQQIRNSAIEFLKTNGINFIEIPLEYVGFLTEINFQHVHTICCHGGGNLGDVYMLEVATRDYIIRLFKDKKIVLFPQTFYCDNADSPEIAITRQVFDNHPNLVLTAREHVSYDNMKKVFSNQNIIFTPDIVMSSDCTKKYKSNKRKGVLCLFRRDIEKSLTNEQIEQMLFTLLGNDKVTFSDTVVDYSVYDICRDKELSKLFKQISKAKFVITDRLHGMIFCAITNTPCIVLSNYNHKIKSTYETWLKHLDYIHYVEDINNLDVDEVVNKITNAKTKWEPLTDKFASLVAEIKNENNNN